MHRRADTIADATYPCTANSGPTDARPAGDGCTGGHCANDDDRGPRNHHGCPLREPTLTGVELF